MKKYKIRENSLAWYVCKYKVAIGMLALTGAITIGFVAGSELAQAEEFKEPAVKTVKAVKEYIEPIYDVPLDADLQRYIDDLCESYGIDTDLVMAVIGQESNYKADAIGDYGCSLGLMQVQEQYHKARMQRLGVEDLLDPYGNVAVGVDFLADCIEQGKGLTYALHLYNGGQGYADYMETTGQQSEYAESVLTLAERLGA